MNNEISGTQVTIQVLNFLFGVFVLSGAVIFFNWLTKTDLGKRSLDGSRPRRNNMPLWVPVIIWVAWVLLISTGGAFAIWISDEGDLPEWQKDFVTYITLAGLEIFLIIIMLVTARNFFARRLKGFGFETQTIWKDFKSAILNLWGILPVVFGVTALVSWVAKELLNQPMQTNQALKTLSEYKDGNVAVKAAVFMLAVLVVPVFEEILFRGLIQSAIRKVISGPWVSIIFVSGLFAAMHPVTHWPTLFVLSMCLGYSYEKSGSLYRPIFIHILFNLIGVLATLNQTNGGGS